MLSLAYELVEEEQKVEEKRVEKTQKIHEQEGYPRKISVVTATVLRGEKERENLDDNVLGGTPINRLGRETDDEECLCSLMAEPSSEMQSTGARFLQKAEAVTFALNGFTSPRDVGCQRRKSNVLKTGFESHQLAAEISRLWRISLMAILSFHPPTKHVIYIDRKVERWMDG